MRSVRWRKTSKPPRSQAEIIEACKRGDTWVQQSGEQIPIRSMADAHLINTIKMLDRECKKHNSEGRKRKTPAQRWPVYTDLYLEVFRRNLEVV